MFFRNVGNPLHYYTAPEPRKKNQKLCMDGREIHVLCQIINRRLLFEVVVVHNRVGRENGDAEWTRREDNLKHYP
jgi:hypothetical protein